MLQTLLVALLVGFAVQAHGPRAASRCCAAIGHLQRLVFRVLAMIMWVAPIGAFGAIAAVVGATGVDALKSLAQIMLGFYVTCADLRVRRPRHAALGWSPGSTSSQLLRYLGREFLLILSTSSSESALPRLIAKMEHLGVTKPVVGITVPTGYSFNLDGTAIYLTMASLFIADALGKPLSVGEQISLLLFMIIASKGAAGVTGAGLATLAGGLQSHRPDLVDGVGLIVGIDRFMSEARALTNFAGNAVATVLVGTWTGEFDRDRAAAVLAGDDPFDEATMLDDDDDADEAASRPDEKEAHDGGSASLTIGCQRPGSVGRMPTLPTSQTYPVAQVSRATGGEAVTGQRRAAQWRVSGGRILLGPARAAFGCLTETAQCFFRRGSSGVQSTADLPPCQRQVRVADGVLYVLATRSPRLPYPSTRPVIQSSVRCSSAARSP